MKKTIHFTLASLLLFVTISFSQDSNEITHINQDFFNPKLTIDVPIHSSTSTDSILFQILSKKKVNRKEMTDEEIVNYLASTSQPLQVDKGARPETVWGTKDTERYIEAGISFNNESLKDGSTERQYQEHLKSQNKTGLTLAVSVLIGLIIIINFVYFTRPTDAPSDKKSNIVVVDNDTLKKKFGINK